MGLMPATTQAAPNDAFKFDNFEDTFDFGEASFSHAKSQSTESATPAAAAAAVSPSFDDAFSLPASSPAPPKAVAAPLSFDDAFEVSTNGENVPQTQNQSFTFPVPEATPAPAQISVDTGSGYASNGVRPENASVRSTSPTAVRGSSTSTRTTSPPPRTSSPKLAAARPRPSKEATPRPGSTLTPEAAGPSRTSRLSIHFPFGRSKSSKEKKDKKDKQAKDHGHDTAGGVMPPVPSIPELASVREDYVGDRYEGPDPGTPEPDGDIPPLKQLMELGFPRDKALTALENNNYNFQRALNKLLAAA